MWRRFAALCLASAAWSGIAFAQDVPAEDEAAFAAFVESFRIDAVASGIDPAFYDREMATAAPLPSVREAQANQPEFVKPVWDYVDRAASSSRKERGREGLAEHAALLNAIGTEYAVPPELIVAIWGLESSFGAFSGNTDVLSALGTIAYKGRRQTFGREQLLAALHILQDGHATRKTLRGAWAGAMGQTQFIPTTYRAYAVDHDGDGDKDLWSDPGDIFASTANYLSAVGARSGLPWGFEVTLPDDFDYAEAVRTNRQSVGHWLAAGVEVPSGSIADRIDLNERAAIIVPAGAAGPAFLVTDNFRAILRYNNATSYALGVGVLSDAIAGRNTALSRGWPRDDRLLTYDERVALQEALAERGYDPGPVDGIIGSGTRRALRAWQRDEALSADGYASAAVLTQLGGGK